MVIAVIAVIACVCGGEFVVFGGKGFFDDTNKKAACVVEMGVDACGVLEAGVENLAFPSGEAGGCGQVGDVDRDDAQGVGGILLEDVIDDTLVFFGCVGACGVDDAPAGFAQEDGFAQDRPLEATKLIVGEAAEFFEDTGVFAGGSFARTRNIDHDAIKGAAAFGEITSVFAKQGGVVDPQSFEDAAHGFDTPDATVICDECSCILHLYGDLCGLVAGGCTHIEDALVRLGIQQKA